MQESLLANQIANANKTFGGKVAKRFWEKVEIKSSTADCWEWKATKHHGGYGHFGIAQGPASNASRFAWQLANGPIENGLHVLHKCDNPPCCNPSHLFLGTRSDNIRDAVRKNRHGAATHPNCFTKGEEHYLAKLNAPKVREIRLRYSSGLIGTRTLAKEFGISRSTLLTLLKGKSWKHVT